MMFAFLFYFLFSSSCCLYLYVHSYIVVTVDCSHILHNKLIIKKKDKEYDICYCVVTYVTVTVTQSYDKENVIEDSRIGNII